jgi:hypothetical protein
MSMRHSRSEAFISSMPSSPSTYSSSYEKHSFNLSRTDSGKPGSGRSSLTLPTVPFQRKSLSVRHRTVANANSHLARAPAPRPPEPRISPRHCPRRPVSAARAAVPRVPRGPGQ